MLKKIFFLILILFLFTAKAYAVSPTPSLALSGSLSAINGSGLSFFTLTSGSGSTISGTGVATGTITYSGGDFSGSITGTGMTLTGSGTTISGSGGSISYDSSTNTFSGSISLSLSNTLTQPPVCSDGSAPSNGACPSGTYLTCPSGYTLSGGVCSQTAIGLFTLSGSSNNINISGGNSTGAITMVETEECPSGYTVSPLGTTPVVCIQNSGGGTSSTFACTQDGITDQNCSSGIAVNTSSASCSSAGQGELCPYSETQCTKGGTATPTCCNGGVLSTGTCTNTVNTCPNGGTLSGTGSNAVCSIAATAESATDYGSISYTPSSITYSCPSGGTLSGSTCTYTATQTVIPGGFSGYFYSVKTGTIVFVGSGDTLIGEGGSALGAWSGSITYSPSSNVFSGQIYNNWPVSGNPLFNGSGNTIVGSGGSPQVDMTGTITFNGTDFSGGLSWNGGAGMYGSGNTLYPPASSTGYACPSGGTLSGSTCTYTATTSTSTSYSCPSGGTLSGSTCTYTATSTTSGGGFSGSIGSAYGSGYTIYGTGTYPSGNWWGSITYALPAPSNFNAGEFTGTLGNAWPSSGNSLYTGGGSIAGDPYLASINGVGGGADTAGYILLDGTTGIFSGTITNITGTNSLYGSGNQLCDNSGCITYTLPTQSYSCPSGGTLSGSTCTYTATTSTSTSYSCPSGGTLSGSTCTYTATTSTSSNSGYIVYTPSSIGYSCPSGGTLSGSTCTYTATQTGTTGGFTGAFYATSNNQPVFVGSGNTLIGEGSGVGAWSGSITYSPSSNTFSGQIYNNWPSSGNPLYNGSGNTIVGSGGSSQVDMTGTITYNASTNTFSGGISWKGGTAFTGSSNELLAGTQGYFTYTCPSGTTLNSSTATCTYPATSTTQTEPASCPQGYALLGSQCVQYICPLSGSPQGQSPGQNYTCVEQNGSSNYYCSPDICYNNTTNTPVNTPETLPPLQTNNGTVTSNGCSGSIYIFPGQALQCTRFYILGENCCSRAKFLLGSKSCSSNSQKLAEALIYDNQYSPTVPTYPGSGDPNTAPIMNCSASSIATGCGQQGESIYIGDYCSVKLPLVGTCLANSYVFCTFQGLLATMLQAQGRAQLAGGPDAMSWGSVSSPNCSGFTPSQFQALNFSNMNLTEYVNVIKNQVSATFNATAINNQISETTLSISNEIQQLEGGK